MTMTKVAQAMNDYAALECVESYTERKRILDLCRIFKLIREENGSGGKILELFAKYQRMYGLKGLKRKYYVWLKAEEKAAGGGVLALADGRKMKRPERDNPFLRDFKNYCERNRNSGGCRAALDAMMRDFRRGDVAFSFGTWRDIWREQHPGEEVPPYCPASWTPRGMTYENLMQHYAKEKGRDLALLWNRQGMFAAAAKHLPPVLRTRVGLHPGEVYQSDDVWHNIDVYAPGIKGVFQPLEFATYDVASAFKIGSLMKPRSRKVDPKTGKEVRDNLKEQQFRFEVAGIMCNTGFYRGGVTWIGEHGTTRLNDRVLARIASVPGWGELFRWSVSGIMDSPAHKGILMGDGGGNPRMKALCECSHNILHNATAGLLGNRGRDAAHMHESQGAVVKYSEKLIALARKIDPALVPLLQLPILEWNKYRDYFRIIEDDVMDRHDHHLEGWAEKEVVKFRVDEEDKWEPISTLLDMSPERAALIRAKIEKDPARWMCKMRMSRREAWKAGQKDLVRWPVFDACCFLDPSDRRRATVAPDGTISFVDSVYYPGERKIYLAQYRDRAGTPHNLRAGEAVWFYWCPTLPLQIWITDEAGEENFGVAPALKTAAWADPHSIEVAVGQRQHQIAELMADTRARHAESEVARRAAENVNRALMKAGMDAAARGPAPDGEGYGFEELNGAEGEDYVRADADDAGNADALAFLDQVNAV